MSERVPNETTVVEEPGGPEYVVKNRLLPGDQPVHSWYRFVLGYPAHLVREYLGKLEGHPETDCVLDPFSGTATTGVESRLQGYATVSCDANPIAVLATRVKLSWDIDADQADADLLTVLDLAAACLDEVGLKPSPDGDAQLTLFNGPIPTLACGRGTTSAGGFNPNALLPESAARIIPRGFISKKPLMRVLSLRQAIQKAVADGRRRDFLTLALANTIVAAAGNLGFGPEVYRLPPREDADVLGAFSATVTRMTSDLRMVSSTHRQPFPPAHVFREDARLLKSLTTSPQIGLVITSPPYPNEKDYTRSTRLESVLLGLVESRKGLRALKSGLLRSNTRNVFVGDADDAYIRDIPSVTGVADSVENRRRQLGKTSGFERLYHRVTRLYFGGMYRHLVALFPRLRPGARCAYVVGDQMSYFRVHIRTAKLLADVAVKAGYTVEGIELWRTRRSTATGLDLDENVLILKRPQHGTRDNGKTKRRQQTE